MTLIKIHTCTKCGGVLTVHNDRQQYECPYCSVFYDYSYFRSRDVLDQADSSLKVLQYDSAREKYDFILQKEPHNFRALIGKFLCNARINKVEALGKIENFRRITPASINEAEEMALPENKSFFSKLRIMSEYSKSYMNNRQKMQPAEKLNHQKDLLLNDLFEKEKRGEVYVESDPAARFFLGIFLLAIAVALFIAGARNESGDKLNFYVPSVMFLAMAACALSRHDYNKEHYERTREDLKMKYNIDTLGTGKPVSVDETSYGELKAKNNTIEQEFQKLYRELIALLPEDGRSEKAKKQDSTEVTLKKSQSCPQCSGELIVNLDRQVYECPFCGMTYDFDFIRDETAMDEAKEALGNSLFVEADAIFKYILTVDPTNFTALRGRILCAAKWPDLDTVLNDMFFSMRRAHIPTVKERIRGALSNCEMADKEYFELFEKTVSEYEAFKQEMNPNNPARKEHKRLEKMKHDAEDYTLDQKVARDYYNRNSNFYNLKLAAQTQLEYDAAKKTLDYMKSRVEEASLEVNKLSEQGEHSKRMIEKYIREMVKLETAKFGEDSVTTEKENTENDID